MGPEFVSHVDPGLTRESDTCCCRSAAGMERRLRDGPGSGMPGELTHSGLTLSAPRISSYHGALQRMPESVTKAPL